MMSLLASVLLVVPAVVVFVYLVGMVVPDRRNKMLKSRYGCCLPPGPPGWPVLGNLPQMGKGKPHETLAALARRYGPLFHLRLGSVDVVVASSSSVASEFLKKHDANFSDRPPNSGAEHVAYNYQDMVFAPYGPRWRMLRKLSNVHLLSNKALEAFRGVRQEEVGRLVRSLEKGSSEVQQLGQELNLCVTNALSRAVLGRRVFGVEKEKENEKEKEGKGAEEFKEMVVELMQLAGVFNIGDFVPWLAWMDLQGVVGKMKRLHARFDRFFDRLISEQRGSDKDDLLSVMLRLNDDHNDLDGPPVTHTEIKGVLLNMFTAGTDTTSSTVEWAMAELVRHPEVLAKAQAEIESVVGRERLVSDADLGDLPYLQAVVKETFRLHPSTPLSLPRMASQPCNVNGYHIPEKTTLMVNVWAIARDPAVWANPLEFRPARFLPGGERPHADVRGNDFEVIPFGAGRRICAGVGLGVRMVTFLIATLVHAFDWSLPDGIRPQDLNMEEAYGLTLQRAEPLTLRPVPRLQPKAYHQL